MRRFTSRLLAVALALAASTAHAQQPATVRVDYTHSGWKERAIQHFKEGNLPQALLAEKKDCFLESTFFYRQSSNKGMDAMPCPLSHARHR